MKIRLANLFDQAARTTLLVSTFGIPAVGVAQTESSRVLDHPAAVSQEKGDSSAKAMHVLEMKVELAWLGDPVTSPWRLEARTFGGTLEVHGLVPTEAVLRHALQMARAYSSIPVASKVGLDPALRAPAMSKPQEVLHRQAFEALQKTFPGQAPSITIITRTDGEILLKGSVARYEDKLAISRHLRRATSCSCISNQLQVLADATAPPPERANPATVQPVAHLPNPDRAVPGGAVEAKAEKAQSSPSKPGAKPLVYQTKWRRMDPSEVALPKKAAPATAKEPLGAAKPEGTHVFLRVIPSATLEGKEPSGNRALAKTEMAHLSREPREPRPNPNPPLTASDISLGKPLYPAPAPAPVRAPLLPPLSVAKREPYVSEGVIIMESAVKPAVHSLSPAIQKPAPILRSGPYVTSGMILFDSANEQLQNSNPALRALQARLQQQIASACGKSNSDIEVTAATETDLSVRIKAHSALEGEQLSNRIFQLPELAPCQVSLDVVIVR
jgi:hypothetical protein